jgi:hypothetical protein
VTNRPPSGEAAQGRRELSAGSLEARGDGRRFEAARHIVSPDGQEYVVEIWTPLGAIDGPMGLETLALLAGALLGWRIAVKPLPVRWGRAVHRERVRSRRRAIERMDELVADIQSGRLPT